ncbi:MAG: hypothetical protein QM752_03515 [Gammaproteobacteria bacterium]
MVPVPTEGSPSFAEPEQKVAARRFNLFPCVSKKTQRRIAYGTGATLLTAALGGVAWGGLELASASPFNDHTARVAVDGTLKFLTETMPHWVQMHLDFAMPMIAIVAVVTLALMTISLNYLLGQCLNRGEENEALLSPRAPSPVE